MINVGTIGHGRTPKVRLLTLMIYMVAGGRGYEPAIEKLAKECPDFYEGIIRNVKSIKEDNK